ncbi:hypothetical protein [Actinomadura chibensis]|uniref:Uncharacterized protein n=1 Tax=Actinomadura chibensis TaxID=392828 RepID=A0A5D0NWB5_9ACTN|nr:hypothetical protein [Actinomadura chibensis]TYB48973.1 hypothetical protein FXF69_07450 [Actinomadura chibensis]
MPDPASAITRLRPPRRRGAPRREARRFVRRDELQVLVLPSVPPAQAPRSGRARTTAWTLYARWRWAVATASAERAKRRARPPWR